MADPPTDTRRNYPPATSTMSPSGVTPHLRPIQGPAHSRRLTTETGRLACPATTHARILHRPHLRPSRCGMCDESNCI